MSLRGIFDGGGVRKQNGHWQSSGKQENIIVYDGMSLVRGNPNPVIFKVNFDPLVGITFNRTLHFEMTNVTTADDPEGEWTQSTGFMGLANDPAYGDYGTVEVRELDNHKLSYQNTSGNLVSEYDWRYSYSQSSVPKLVVYYGDNNTYYTRVVADVTYSMTPVQQTPRFICETFVTNSTYSFDMNVSFTIPPIPSSETKAIEEWSGKEVQLIIKPYIRVPRRGDDVYLRSRTTFTVTLP